MAVPSSLWLELTDVVIGIGVGTETEQHIQCHFVFLQISS